jgi:hypothetical protein
VKERARRLREFMTQVEADSGKWLGEMEGRRAILADCRRKWQGVFTPELHQGR